jgi:sialic acid synthase SpsE
MTKTFIIAEAGLNHMGYLSQAFALADAAWRVGADAVKFQTLIVDKVLRKSDPDYELIKKINLDFKDTTILKHYCDELGIEFMSTPGDVESLDFLEDLDVKRIKIGSDDLTNEPLNSKARATQIPLLVSTGMATMDEIENILRWKSNTTLMHCVSLYPAPLESLNLLAIRTMQSKGYNVGYSDHSIGVLAPVIAVAVGATVIEKHFRVSDDCIDRVVSANTAQFTQMVSSIRSLEWMLGDGVKAPCKEELAIRDKLRKSPKDWLRGPA